MFEFKMPKMGESITEATIINWLKSEGDYVEADETIVEVATDKVDNDVPAPVSGVITEIRFQKDDVVEVGTVLALINSEGVQEARSQKQDVSEKNSVTPSAVEVQQSKTVNQKLTTNPNAFISPLIISIAQKENLSIEELQTIPGSGTDGRLQKSDVFTYLKNRKYPLQSQKSKVESPKSAYPTPKINFVEGKDRLVEMDRMRKLIADHMVYSKQTSPHVTSYIEVDVTNLVQWRNDKDRKSVV
jgi:2-oxoglutarate dehydrogenase E2 component (dihydrolipoamide succinyltransferase)